MLTPDHSTVQKAIEDDKVMAMLDAEEVALAAKERKRVEKIQAEINGHLLLINKHTKERTRAGQAIRGIRKHIRFLKYKTKRRVRPWYSIERRRAQRCNWIRKKVEKEYLRQKVLEFRATLKVNTRPPVKPTADTTTQTPL